MRKTMLRVCYIQLPVVCRGLIMPSAHFLGACHIYIQREYLLCLSILYGFSYDHNSGQCKAADTHVFCFVAN